MKFDVVIGNPPYQENDNGQRDDGAINASAKPLYHLFVQNAGKISQMQCFVIPARWISGAGKGLSGFTKQMVSDNRIKHFSYFTRSKDIFQNNEIKGGICYFVSDNDYHDKANIEVYSDGRRESSKRFLDEHNIGVFIPYKELSNILSKVEKIQTLQNSNIQQIVSPLKPYGLRTDFFRNPEKYALPPIQKFRKHKEDIKIFGLEEGKRSWRYIPRDYPIPTGVDTVDSYKVFFSYAYGSGTLGETTATPILGLPKQICTETYLTIGSFNNKSEAENLIKYIKTKFFRVLVGILKTTQHATRTFKLVPMQSFNNNSDIDWSRSISEIDQQLYLKYGLSQDEIDFIENNVKEME